MDVSVKDFWCDCAIPRKPEGRAERAFTDECASCKRIYYVAKRKRALIEVLAQPHTKLELSEADAQRILQKIFEAPHIYPGVNVERFKTLATSKTVWGAIFASGAWLASQPRIGVTEVVQAIGQICVAVGVRDAIQQK